jgi:hypothetical protein
MAMMDGYGVPAKIKGETASDRHKRFALKKKSDIARNKR